MRLIGMTCAAVLGAAGWGAAPAPPWGGASAGTTGTASAPASQPMSQPASQAATVAAESVSVAVSPDARPQYWFGVAVVNIPAGIARQLKLGPEQGLMVDTVLSGTPAESAGLKKDDLLIEVNGKPLTSQEDLARAANTRGFVAVSLGKVTGTPVVQASQFTFLRDGDRQTVEMMPVPRPAQWAVIGPRAESFSLNGIGRGTSASGAGPGGVAAGRRGASEMQEIILPNGKTASVAGYRVNLQDQGTTVRAIGQALGDGQQVVILQETDGAGNVKNTISAGGKKYAVEAGKLGNLPPNLRMLAEQMLAGASQAATTGPTASMERVMKTQQDLIDAQQKQMQEMQAQLGEMQRQMQTLLKNTAKAGGIDAAGK